MESPSLQDVQSHLWLNRDKRLARVAVRVASGQWVRVRVGAYLELPYLRDFEQSWHVHDAVNLARIAAVARSSPSAVMVGQSAALVHGLPRLRSVGHVHLGLPFRPGGGATALPAVLGHPAVPVASSKIVRHRFPGLARNSSWVAGVNVADLQMTAVTSCWIDTPEEAFVLVCAVLKRLSNFSKQRQEQCRAREEHHRQALIRLAGAPGRGRSAAIRAIRLISLADAGCESIAEARLLWILRSHGLDRVSTQHKVVCEGQTFFIDIAIAGVKVALEFDGRIKYTGDAREQLGTFEQQQRRHQMLERAGWIVIRFMWEDLANPAAVIETIRQRLAHAGRSLTCAGGAKVPAA